MVNHLLTDTSISGKLKTIFFASVLLFTLPGFANAQSAAFGVTFGQPQDNGGPCVGKGVCKESFDLNTTNTYTSNPEAITVTFQVSTQDPNILMMSFSMSELTQRQPDQVSFFTSTTATYNFDGTFNLTGSEFSGLNLMPNAKITPECKSSVQTSGDFVTVSYAYSHGTN